MGIFNLRRFFNESALPVTTFGRAQLPHMSNFKIVHTLRSFVVFPILATNFLIAPMGITGAPTQALSVSDQNGPLATVVLDNKQAEREAIAQNIDEYFREHDMPLAGFGMKMVIEAEKNDIDPYLIPAIAVRESTGGKSKCKHKTFNPFGWNSCKVGFSSYDEAIEVLAKNLGGNNPATARHYDGKTTEQILKKYNPPSIVPHYASQVMRIMDTIDSYGVDA